MYRIISLSVFILVTSKLTFATPKVGATYRLDRVKFPQSLVICTSEKLMSEWMLIELKDAKLANEKLSDFKTNADIGRIRSIGGCVRVNSAANATIIENGTEFHKANFFSFPFHPMWGSFLYFGDQVW